jgi:hypothetical protein
MKALRDDDAKRLEKLRPQVEAILVARLVPDVAGKAWGMGGAITMVPMFHLTKGVDDRGKAMWGQISKEIKALAGVDQGFDGEALSPLPRLSGSKQDQLKATIKFIAAQRAKLAAMVRRRDGINVADVVYFSSASHLARALHQLGIKSGSATLAAQIRDNAKDARVPETVWAAYADTVEKGGDVSAAWPALTQRLQGFLAENASKP